MDRRKNVVMYLMTMTVTYFCFNGFTYLLSVVLVQRSGDADLLGTVNALTMIPVIFLNLVAGYLSDKVAKRNILIVTDLLTGILFILAYFLLHYEAIYVAVFAVTSVVNRSIGTFYSIGSKAIIPQLFSEKNILKINSIQSEIRQGCVMIASVIIGFLLIYLEPHMMMLIMGMLFLCSVVADININVEIGVNYEHETNTKRDSFKSVFTYIIGNKRLFSNVLYTVIANLFESGLLVFLPWIAITQFNSRAALSVFMLCQSAGILLGPFVLRYAKMNDKTVQFIFLLTGCSYLMCFGNYWLLSIGVFFNGLFRAAFDIAYFSQIQTTVKGTMVGRVIAIIFVITGLSMPLGSFLVSRLINFTGTLTLPLSGVCFLGMALLIMAIRKTEDK